MSFKIAVCILKGLNIDHRPWQHLWNSFRNMYLTSDSSTWSLVNTLHTLFIVCCFGTTSACIILKIDEHTSGSRVQLFSNWTRLVTVLFLESIFIKARYDHTQYIILNASDIESYSIKVPGYYRQVIARVHRYLFYLNSGIVTDSVTTRKSNLFNGQ